MPTHLTYDQLGEVLAAARATVTAWTNAEDLHDVALAMRHLSRILDRLDATVTA